MCFLMKNEYIIQFLVYIIFFLNKLKFFTFQIFFLEFLGFLAVFVQNPFFFFFFLNFRFISLNFQISDFTKIGHFLPTVIYKYITEKKNETHQQSCCE